MILKELLEYIDSDISVLAGEFKCTIVGNRAIFLQNFKKIITYNTEKISFKLSKNYFYVEGNNLSIKEMGKNEVIITGCFNSFSFQTV